MATVIFYKNDKYVADVADVVGEDLRQLKSGEVPAEIILDDCLAKDKAFWKNGSLDYEIEK